MASDQFQPGRRPERRPEHTAPDQRVSDRSPWNWLLVVPIVLCMVTPLFNRKEPEFLDCPAFDGLQLSFVIIGVICTGTVYLRTRSKGGE
jgi:hypothetical protein